MDFTCERKEVKAKVPLSIYWLSPGLYDSVASTAAAHFLINVDVVLPLLSFIGAFSGHPMSGWSKRFRELEDVSDGLMMLEDQFANLSAILHSSGCASLSSLA